MARMLAVDFDRHEVRYVLATCVGRSLRVRMADSAQLIDVVEDGESQLDLGRSLQAALLDEKVGRADALVSVDRGSIELLHLTLPPARDAELPELVLNQAMRESSSINDDTLLDFVPLDDDPTQPRRVIAVALGLDQLQRIKDACSAAGLKPKRLLLRSYAAASLLSQTVPDREGSCLLVNLVGDDLDLTVVARQKAVFSRTVRLPRSADSRQAAGRVTAEIQRTLTVAAQGQSADAAVRSVYIFGGPSEHVELAEQIGEEVDLPVTILDPFEAAGVSTALNPGNPGRFASLLGMLNDEAHGRRHAVDFLRPRRRPRQIGRRQVIAIASVAVALAVMTLGYLAYAQFAQLDKQKRLLQEELTQLNGLIKQAEAETVLADSVRQWQAGDVLWLEELREMSTRMPPNEDAVVLRMSMTSGRSGDGLIDVSGLMSDPSVLVRMENGLRDKYHTVRGKSVNRSGRDEDYCWVFGSSIRVQRRDKAQYAADSAGASRVSSKRPRPGGSPK